MDAKNIQIGNNLQEHIKPILQGLPISVFHTEFRKDSYHFVSWHWHEAFQYCYVTEGIVDFDVPGKTYTITEGNGIFINYKCLHQTRNHDDTPSSYLCIDVPPSFISYDTQSAIFQKYLKPAMDHPVNIVLRFSRHQKSDKAILEQILKVRDLVRSEEELIEIDVRITVMEMWKLTWQKMKKTLADKNSQRKSTDRLRGIISYIQKHYSEKITLEDIAAYISLSPNECSRYFKTMTGRQLFSYLNSYRINKSIDLIRDTDLSLAEITVAVGFCNQSYYTECFRKEKGMTPKKYQSLCVRKAENVLKNDIVSMY